MKRINYYLTTFVVLCLLCNCGQNPNVPTTSDAKANKVLKTKIDTLLPLYINGKSYRLIITHNEYPTGSKDSFPTITARIVDEVNHDTLLKKTICSNHFGNMVQVTPGNYWLTFLFLSYGSGWSGVLYKIKSSSEFSFQYILNFDELSFWHCNREANEILFFQGIWGDPPDGEKLKKEDTDASLESHFDPHHQYFYKIKITGDTVMRNKIGLTSLKYSPFDYLKSLRQFSKDEPELSRIVDWNDYDLEKEYLWVVWK